MSIIRLLREQHEVILGQIDSLLELVAAPTPDAAAAGRLLDFFVEFADGQHHAIEERELFPALRAAGMPTPGPVDVMLREHELGRELIARMRLALAENDWPQLIQLAEHHARLLRAHIHKENEVLFRMAERLLGGHALMS